MCRHGCDRKSDLKRVCRHGRDRKSDLKRVCKHVNDQISLQVCERPNQSTSMWMTESVYKYANDEISLQVCEWLNQSTNMWMTKTETKYVDVQKGYLGSVQACKWQKQWIGLGVSKRVCKHGHDLISLQEREWPKTVVRVKKSQVRESTKGWPGKRASVWSTKTVYKLGSEQESVLIWLCERNTWRERGTKFMSDRQKEPRECGNI